MQFILSAALFFIVSSKAADVTCPKGPITSNGAFPATGIAPFPANYGCAMEFNIPNGQIIKFMSQSNAVNENVDRMTIMDSAGTLYEMASGEALLYTPANYSKLWIQTKTDTANFYISWQYIDVTKYTKVWNPTGTILPLNLTSKSYYQFFSNQSQVVFHIGNLDRNNDPYLFNIYVYDGEDLNSRYIGTLSDLIQKPTLTGSTRNSLVLVNYYGSKSKSWGIANDWAAIAPYKDYNLIVMSQGIDYTYNAYIPDGLQSAITFYCIDSSESYITSLTLKDRSNGRQFVAFSPLTPTNNYPQLLTYNVNTQISQSLPQQILSNTFTMVLYHCETQLTISSGPLFIWTLAVPGRTGQIFSPSAWNPLTFNQKPYSTNFSKKLQSSLDKGLSISASTQKLKFTFNFGYLIINNPTEQINIEIGSSDSQPFSLGFNHTALNIGTQEAYGTYMSTSFTGKTLMSEFAMTFRMESNATTTPAPVETTTKSSAVILNISLLTLFIAKLF
ncbi:hypothetical protein CAEBREN_26423 [Caenorhabditis brenneri]|uniref:CUB-like domain-containing protein n=1 Tax=Caenorhabditis brenneri TaxID=135651 RepID=G0MRT3_CAEBE|nr:hypothetical protein CAEBREN_26423 [Caenorhabditis brenneri]